METPSLRGAIVALAFLCLLTLDPVGVASADATGSTTVMILHKGCDYDIFGTQWCVAEDHYVTVDS